MCLLKWVPQCNCPVHAKQLMWGMKTNNVVGCVDRCLVAHECPSKCEQIASVACPTREMIVKTEGNAAIQNHSAGIRKINRCHPWWPASRRPTS